MNRIGFFLMAGWTLGCGGGGDGGDMGPGGRTGGLAPYDGPACSDVWDCPTFECFVPPSVPEGTPTDGVCHAAPFGDNECRRIVEDGVATALMCV